VRRLDADYLQNLPKLLDAGVQALCIQSAVVVSSFFSVRDCACVLFERMRKGSISNLDKDWLGCTCLVW